MCAHSGNALGNAIRDTVDDEAALPDIDILSEIRVAWLVSRSASTRTKSSYDVVKLTQ